MNITSSKFPIIAGALWIVAFLSSFHVLPSLTVTLFTLCVLLTFLWSFLVLSKDVENGWDIPRTPVLGLCGAFFLLVICSLFWSEVKPVTLLTICQFSVFPLTFLTLALRPDEKMFRFVAYAFVPLFIGLGIWAIVQIYFFFENFYGQAQSPLQDPSSLGALFSLILFCAIGWLLTDAPKAHKIWGLVLCCALIGGIYATGGRGPVFSFFPALIVMLAALWPRVKKAKGFMFSLLAAFVFIPVVMNLTADFSTVEMMRRLAQTVTFEMRGGDISNMRIYLWSSVWEIIKDHPILGTGYGTLFLYLGEYMDPRYPAAAVHAHSDVLQIWSDLGIIGVVLLYAFMISVAVRTFRALRKIGADDKGNVRIVIVTTFCALLAMIVHSHVTFNLYNPAIIMPSAFILAVWFAATRLVLNDDVAHITAQENFSPVLNKAVISLPFLMLGSVFFINMAGEYYADKARDDLFAHQMMNFADNINKSGRISQNMNYRSYLLAVNVPLTLMEVDKANKTAADRRKLYDQGMGYMNRVLALNPRSDTAYYYMAKLQQLAGADAVPKDAQKIEHLYSEAVRLNPLHLGARVALYDIYRAEGRTKEDQYALMEPVADKIHITPQAIDYYKALGGMYVEYGDYIKAQEALAALGDYYKTIANRQRIQQNGIMEKLMRFDPMQAPVNDASFPQGGETVPETSGKTGEGL